MQINSNISFRGSHETRVMVTTNRCRYDVWFAQGIITLSGPGVNETADIEMVFETLEDYASYIVLMFENNLWPE